MDQGQTTKGWFLIDHCRGRIVELLEVVPEDDLKEHIATEDCECIPLKDINNEGIPMLIHNSFDGRESDERDERGN